MLILSLQLAHDTYARIQAIAERDTEAWDSKIRVEAGYIQITKEFIPARRHLLLKYVLMRNPYLSPGVKLLR